MRRGEIWTVSDSGYTGKPRPAVIVQSDDFPAADSVTLCALTSDEVAAPLVRIPINPTSLNGLHSPCWVMIDKVSTVRLPKMGRRIGRLDKDDMTAVNSALRLFLQLG